MSSPYLGSIMITPYTRVVENWMLCWGQELLVNQNVALYSLMGISFGGTAGTKFNLPDLRGRVPMGYGVSPAGAARQVGNTPGSATQILGIANMPQHSHAATMTTSVPAQNMVVGVTGLMASVTVNTNTASPPNGTSNVPSASTGLAAPPNHTVGGFQFKVYGPAGSTALANTSATVGGSLSGTVTVPSLSFNSAVTVDATGGTTPVSLIQPVQPFNFQICSSGNYPPRP